MAKGLRLLFLATLFLSSAMGISLGARGIFNGEIKGWILAVLCTNGAFFALALLRPDISGFGRADPKAIIDILAQFPGPVKLTSSRRKWFFLLFTMSALFVGSLLILTHPLSDRQEPFWIWVGLLCSGFGIIISLLTLLPNGPALILRRDEFELINLVRHKCVRWDDTNSFEVFAVQIGSEIVIFDDASGRKKGILAIINTGFSGRNSYLPDTYGLSAENLTSLMNQWRERALQAKG
jgi:hypothetical protein